MQAFIWIILALAGSVLYLACRSYFLFKNSQALFEQSRRFSRDYFVGDAKRPVLTYVVLGDSTAFGQGAGRMEGTYPYAIAESLTGKGRYVHVINLAVSGARIGDVEKSQLPALAKLAPNVITLSVGANDATHRTPPEEYSATLNKVLKALKGYPSAKILMATTPDMALIPAIQPFYADWAGGIARRQNDSLKTALVGSAIRTVDLYNEGKLDYNEDAALYAPDKFHPSVKGYKRWAQLFIRALKP